MAGGAGRFPAQAVAEMSGGEQAPRHGVGRLGGHDAPQQAGGLVVPPEVEHRARPGQILADLGHSMRRRFR
jgi:hypothetical protein